MQSSRRMDSLIALLMSFYSHFAPIFSSQLKLSSNPPHMQHMVTEQTKNQSKNVSLQLQNLINRKYSMASNLCAIYIIYQQRELFEWMLGTLYVQLLLRLSITPYLRYQPLKNFSNYSSVLINSFHFGLSFVHFDSCAHKCSCKYIFVCL